MLFLLMVCSVFFFFLVFTLEMLYQLLEIEAKTEIGGYAWCLGWLQPRF